MNHQNATSCNPDLTDATRDTIPADLADLALDEVAEAACLSVPRTHRSPPAMTRRVERPESQRSPWEMMLALMEERDLEHSPTLPTGVPPSRRPAQRATDHAASAPPALPPLPEDMLVGDRIALLDWAMMPTEDDVPSTVRTAPRPPSTLMTWTAAALIIGALTAAFLLTAIAGPDAPMEQPVGAKFVAR